MCYTEKRLHNTEQFKSNILLFNVLFRKCVRFCSGVELQSDFSDCHCAHQSGVSSNPGFFVATKICKQQKHF